MSGVREPLAPGRPRFRLAAIDLDDTLLGPDHEVSPRNAHAVQLLLERGVQCVIASGRMHEATTRFARGLGLRGPIISYNGALVRDDDAGEVWLHLPAPAAPSAQVIAFCAAHGHHLNYYLNDRLFVARRGEWAELYIRQTSSPMEEIGDLTPLAGTEPTKMILIDTPEVTDSLLSRFRREMGDALYITKTNPEYLEFMNPRANKGAALALTAERLGISREEVIAFGDGANDLPMLRWAGFSVAMGSARPEVLAAADFTAPPCHEDGFGVAVERLFGF